MAIPGETNLLASAAPGNMQIPASNFAQAPNVTSSGAFTYSIPIQVPPGTHGMTPKLALSYSSAAGDGNVGIGWSLSGLSVITRCPQTYARDGQAVGVGYNANDRFCLDGKRLLITSSGSYGDAGTTYQTEVSNFATITAEGSQNHQPKYFTVVYPNGMQYEYGNNGSTINAYGSTSIIRLWALDKITDRTGNYIAFSYTIYNSGLDYALTEIDYTGNASMKTSPYNAVCFDYGTRKDLVPGYQSGYELEPSELLSTISTYTGTGGSTCGDGETGTKRLVYALSYEEANWGSGISAYWHNELTGLTECDAVSPNKCLASLIFSWQGPSSKWSLGAQTNNTPGASILEPVDVNGDGITDALIYYSSNCGSSDYQVYLGPNFSGSGSADYLYWSSGSGTPITYDQSPACFDNAYSTVGYGPPWPLDINGDGHSDIMLNALDCVYVDTSCLYYAQVIEPLINNGNNDFALNTNNNPEYVTFGYRNAFTSSPVGGDMNGDGLGDFFVNVVNATSGEVAAYAYQGNGGGIFSPDAGHTGFYADSILYGADFTGYGCTDVLSQSPNESKSQVLASCFNPGSNPWQAFSSAPAYCACQVVIGDFNGDSKADVLTIPQSGNGTLYLSTGTGFVAQKALIPATWDRYEVVAGDFTGDGKTDIALISQTTGDHLIYVSTGNFTSSTESGFKQYDTGITGIGGSSAVVSDWNNDGAADL